MAHVSLTYEVALRFFKLRKIDSYFSTETNLDYEVDIDQTHEDYQRQVRKFKELLDSKQVYQVRLLKNFWVFPIQY